MRSVCVAGLCLGVVFAQACSDEPADKPVGTPSAGAGGAGEVAGSTSVAGNTNEAGNTNVGGAETGGGGAAPTGEAGAGGSAGAADPPATAGGGGASGAPDTGGAAAMGGTSGTASGGADVGGAGNEVGGAGNGGADSGPQAVAVVTPTTAAPAGWENFEATATWTQVGDETTLVVELTGCPDGLHISHLHANHACGADGEAAGGHWIPNGEVLEDIECSAGVGTYSHTENAEVWSVGDGGDTDVTRYSYIIHALSSAENAGAKASCGVIEMQ